MIIPLKKIQYNISFFPKFNKALLKVKIFQKCILLGMDYCPPSLTMSHLFAPLSFSHYQSMICL